MPVITPIQLSKIVFFFCHERQKARLGNTSPGFWLSGRRVVGLGRLELPTSPLSGVRSNHLSYRPKLFHLGPAERWWSWSGSNRRPPECKSGALPAELQPPSPLRPARRKNILRRIGRGRPRLTGRQGPEANTSALLKGETPEKRERLLTKEALVFYHEGERLPLPLAAVTPPTVSL